MYFSDAASGWEGWALQAHPEFGISVNPIPFRGVDYAHGKGACPPGFENLVACIAVLDTYNLSVKKPQMIHNETLEMDENNPLFAICPFF